MMCLCCRFAGGGDGMGIRRPGFVFLCVVGFQGGGLRGWGMGVLRALLLIDPTTKPADHPTQDTRHQVQPIAAYTHTHRQTTQQTPPLFLSLHSLTRAPSSRRSAASAVSFSRCAAATRPSAAASSACVLLIN